MIKQKIGQCIDCEDGPNKPIIAGRCQYHYWGYRNKVTTDKRKQSDLSEECDQKQRALDSWFANQVNNLPKHCENCGKYLNPYAPWGAKTYIAHIVPKRNFESVMCHPLNRMFLCAICHTNYDNWPEVKVMAMPVFAIAVERFLSIAPSIVFEELNSLPDFFSTLLNN